MPKVAIRTLDNITNNSEAATLNINNNFKALQEAIENTISRDGTVPNYMEAALDMNSNRIINASDPVDDNDLITKKYFDENVGEAKGAEDRINAYLSLALEAAQKSQTYSATAVAASSNADEKADEASQSAAAALVSEQNAKASELAAASSKQVASNSADAAYVSEQNAKASELAAASSKQVASNSADAAYVSEQNAKTSETIASDSRIAASQSASAAAQSATKAKGYADSINPSQFAQKDLSNVPAEYDYVVESGSSTAGKQTAFYVQFKSGLLIQWGQLETISGNNTVTLPKPFADTSYQVFHGISNRDFGKASVGAMTVTALNKTTSNWILKEVSVYEHDWMAIGQGAKE